MTASVEERPVQEAEAPTARSKTESVEPKAPEPVAEVEEYATFDDLLAKKAREREITVRVNGRKLKMHLRAIGHVAYDRLQAECPPDKDEQTRGLIFSDAKFGPRLIAAVVSRPKMDLDRANRLWNDPNWAGGEINELYRACIEVCQMGLNVDFGDGG